MSGNGQGSQEPQATSGTRGGRAVLVLVAVLLALVLASGIAVRNAIDYFTPQEAVIASEAGGQGTIPEPVGDPEAALKIEVAVGHCITFVADAVRDAIVDYPELARGEFHSYEGPSGQELCREYDELLAFVAFNGETRVTIQTDGGEREIHFSGPPGDAYTMDDLAEALRTRWIEIHGDVPEGFEEKLAKVRAGSPMAPAD